MKAALLAGFLVLTGTIWGVAADSPPDVLARLVANASRTPPGPVENDVSKEVVSFAQNMAKNFPGADVKTDPASIRAGIAQEFDTFTIEGTMISLFLNDSAAVFAGKVKLTADQLQDWAEEKRVDPKADHGTQLGVTFGPGMSQLLDTAIKPDGHLIATVGFVKESGAWKVYCIYFSTAPMETDNRDYLVEHLKEHATGK